MLEIANKLIYYTNIPIKGMMPLEEKEFEFAERLKEVRETRGMDQTQLGRKLRVSQNNISNWEIGVSAPKLALFKRLCNALNTSADYLLGLPLDELVEKLYKLDDDGRHTVEAVIDSQLRRMGK